MSGVMHAEAKTGRELKPLRQDLDFCFCDNGAVERKI